MRKKEIIELTAREAGTSQVKAKKVVNAYLNTIRQALEQGEDITLDHIGKFNYIFCKGRSYGFKAEEQYEVPDHYRIGFKISKKIKDSVKELPLSYFESEEFEDYEEE